MNAKKILWLVMISLLTSVAWGQQAPGTLTGKVTSAKGDALTGATVYINGLQAGATADEQGKYTIKNIVPGTYTVVITSVGHDPLTQEVVIKAGETMRLNPKLEESSVELDGVEVTGKTFSQEMREAAFTMNAIDTRQFANTTADLNQILNRTTGVRIREQGGMGSNFNFSINGLSGKAVKFFIDGIPMDVLGSSVSLNNIPVNLAERLEVYKGSVPVSLGADAMGGAVNVITNPKITNYLDASYSYGSFNTHRAALTGQVKLTPSGLMLRANSFYNFSNNDYTMKGVMVPEGRRFVAKDVRRFHDDYQAVMGQAELGVVNKKWADVLFAGFAYSASEQDVQTGFTQDYVYGDMTRTNHAYTGSLRYRKKDLFVKGLDMNVFTSLSRDHSVITDTSTHKYAWDGTYLGVAPNGELGSGLQETNIVRPRFFGRVNASYEIDAVHSFNINFTIDRVENEQYNALYTNDAEMTGVLDKRIAGIAYQQNLFNKRLVNTFFAKYYGIKLGQKDRVGGSAENNSDFMNNYGYGVASRFSVSEDIGIKASFERAYRLQETEEVFGNGMTLVANTALLPEHSNNINAGFFVGRRLGKHRLFFEAGGFYRDAKDFIFAVPQERNNTSAYENKSAVSVRGIEGEVRYTWADALSLVVNTTYQNSINETKYSRSTSTIPEATYKNKIPNLPWLFGNADLSFTKKNPFGKEGTRLQFNWYLQYVHWFYLTWEAYGNSNGISNIPDQWIHTTSVSYSFMNERYNLSLEGRNLTDELAYDNYKLQKPGRAFAVKIRYFIK